MATELVDNLTSPGTQVFLTSPVDPDDQQIVVNRPASTTLQQPGGQFRVVVFDPSSGNRETMLVDSRSAWSPTWSVTRGIEGTTPVSFSQGSVVKHVITAGALQALGFNVQLPPLPLDETERIQFVMSIVPSSGDAVAIPFFGSIEYSGETVTDASILWPDGGYGSYDVVTLDPVTTGDVDEYTVDYRQVVDTSDTDRIGGALDQNTGWPVDPSIGWVGWSHTAYLDGPPMSDADAAAQVTPTPEVRLSHITADARIGTGIPQNYYIPSDEELSDYRTRAHSEWFQGATVNAGQAATENPYVQFVTGACASYITNPTTDEIIQWASHKWGIPTDWLRAQCHLETQWNNFLLGDLNPVTDISMFEPDGTPITEDTWSLFPEWCQLPGGLYAFRSVSLIQVQWEFNSGIGAGTDPLRWKSTAFALDFACATIRYTLDDPDGRRTAWGDKSYFPGDYACAQACGWNAGYPWRIAGEITLATTDADTTLDLTLLTLYRGWTITVRDNYDTPANVDILVYNQQPGATEPTLVKQYLGLTSVEAALTTINDDDQIYLIASITGTDTSAQLSTVTSAPGVDAQNAMGYQNGVFQRVASKPWLNADFSDIPSAVIVYHQELMTRNVSGQITQRELPVHEEYDPVVIPTEAVTSIFFWPGDGGGFLWWDEPAEDGNGTWAEWLLVEPDIGFYGLQSYGPGLGWQWDGLGNSTPLRFEIRGNNGFDWNPWSTPSRYGQPRAGLPRQPVSVTVDRNLITGAIELSWTSPPTHASFQSDPEIPYPVLRYLVMPRDSNNNFLEPVDTGSNACFYTFPAGEDGLTLGETYTFWVLALGPAGIGPPSYPSAAVTPAQWTDPSPPTVPPQNVYLYIGDGELVVFYSLVDSDFDGGTAISGYAFWDPDFGGPGFVNMYPEVDTQTASGLTNGTVLRAVVAAFNGDTHYVANGLGPPSDPTPYATVTAGLPTFPTDAAATVPGGTDNAIDLTWTAPAGDIIGYSVIPLIDGVVQPEVATGSSDTSYQITGLIGGTTYTFRIRAINAVGTGPPYTATAAVTPTGAAPTFDVPAGISGGAPNTSFTEAISGGSPGSTFTQAISGGTA